MAIAAIDLSSVRPRKRSAGPVTVRRGPKRVAEKTRPTTVRTGSPPGPDRQTRVPHRHDANPEPRLMVSLDTFVPYYDRFGQLVPGVACPAGPAPRYQREDNLTFFVKELWRSGAEYLPVSNVHRGMLNRFGRYNEF